jgi:hypothetical protein
VFSGYSHSKPNSFVGVDGEDIVDAKGDALLLRGTNLGNWLLP